LKYLLIFNVILIIIMSIFEIKNIKTFLFWCIIIFIFSILGFVAYIILGNALKFKSKKNIYEKYKSTRNYLSKVHLTVKKINNKTLPKLAAYILTNFQADIWHNNKLDIFTNGQDFFNRLIFDILHAKHHIHLQFYIFGDDFTGKKLSETLIKKAKEGIKIKIIYDAFGCKNIKQSFWENLIKNDIEVVAFFPPLFNCSFFNIKINYRNHRKIAIIDGKISYTGGINIRDDHMNLSKNIKPWRDTQIRIDGSATYALQDIFLNDFSFMTNSVIKKQEIELYFPKINNKHEYALQILESDICHKEKYIYKTYLKIIESAKKYIYIQTPYFIVDKQIISALINAKCRGVNVNIFIPKMPDKKIIYGATILFIKQLIFNNINIFLYNGFIHSKILLTEEIVSIGTCNFDYRSFFLNFENTCLCTDHNFIYKNLKIIKQDINNSELLSKKTYKKLVTKNIFAIFFYKIISKFI